MADEALAVAGGASDNTSSGSGYSCGGAVPEPLEDGCAAGDYGW